MAAALACLPGVRCDRYRSRDPSRHFHDRFRSWTRSLPSSVRLRYREGGWRARREWRDDVDVFFPPSFRYLWDVAAVAPLFGRVLLPHFRLLGYWSGYSLGQLRLNLHRERGFRCDLRLLMEIQPHGCCFNACSCVYASLSLPWLVLRPAVALGCS